MRVITGSAKGAKLETIESMETRPTLDRIKETMFNLIMDDITDASCLDIYSGSGALGIELLSRGAKECHFVEVNSACIDVINRNLEKTRLKERAIVSNTDVQKSFEMFTNKKKFDIIIMDPPYNLMCINETLNKIIDMNLLADDGIIVCECSSGEKIENEKINIEKERMFKKMALYIIKAK